VSGQLRNRYLEPGPGSSFLAGGVLRGRARFRRHNFASDPVPPPGEPPFDLVVCRNVLIYFDTPLVGRVTRLLERAVRPGGELIMGAADALHVSAARKAGLLEPVPAARPAPGGPGRAAPAGQPAAGRRPAPPTRRPPQLAPGRLSAATRQRRLA